MCILSSVHSPVPLSLRGAILLLSHFGAAAGSSLVPHARFSRASPAEEQVFTGAHCVFPAFKEMQTEGSVHWALTTHTLW